MASVQHYNELEDDGFGLSRLRKGTEENYEESQDRRLPADT
jgi:hypothetical protein